jgi:hypothetical protein
MADFGTGLRAHLQTTRSTPAYRYEAAPAPDARELDERRRLEALAAELAGRELALMQREADLAAEHEQMALALARVLREQTAAPAARPSPPVADELAAYRARRYGRAS